MSSFRHTVTIIAVIFAAAFAGLLGARVGVPESIGPWTAGALAGAACLFFAIRTGRGSLPDRPGARPGGPYVSPYEVRFDDTEVVVTCDGAQVSRVAWAELITVGIRIDDAFLPQPWWLLFGRDGKVAHYPGEARGAREMLHELQQRLPGFDNAGVVRAMGMLEGGVVLWERAA